LFLVATIGENRACNISHVYVYEALPQNHISQQREAKCREQVGPGLRHIHTVAANAACEEAKIVGIPTFVQKQQRFTDMGIAETGDMSPR
jgi:hypothetical protein